LLLYFRDPQDNMQADKVMEINGFVLNTLIDHCSVFPHELSILSWG
jgi:hypothetical protein